MADLGDLLLRSAVDNGQRTVRESIFVSIDIRMASF
jgi:hypothetical protein